MTATARPTSPRPTTARRPRTFDEALAALGRPFPSDAAEAARHYRRLARLLHPDTAPAGRAEEAEAAFVRLADQWRRHTGDGAVLTTARGTYPLGRVLATGDLAVLRGAGPDTVLKIPRRPADNDLMEREAHALTRLHTVADARHRAYAPRLVESFRHRGPDGTERRVNALQRLRGFHTLAEVRALHPGGLDPRDAAWMWRRLLVALGWAHRAGIVHGAVLPEHVLIHPAKHGLVLVDWCWSTERGTTVPALVERHRALYPPEVTGRRPATEATDIHLASRCVEQLIGDRAPKPLRAFLRGCTLPAEARRPHDAWRLLAELDEALERLYGPRAFRPFTMPGTRTHT
ncbi:molecular chaperone DnaJ [Streptomyces sp. MI02-7b]|uniref:molecular chaperone DnaJ n=1 Tax=Streptomyces sp. MI02-7b TaxID=462941 RepID=UPI0029B70A94|nr:molecular chaperone DnaJ [Streptomyces sp. MI02-7b]MDX3078481.1 molecular chaperone DnaJ [Streptomyces sp. MI02-7b]